MKRYLARLRSVPESHAPGFGETWPPPKGWKKALAQDRDPHTYQAEVDAEMLSMRKLYEEKSKGMPDLVLTKNETTK